MALHAPAPASAQDTNTTPSPFATTLATALKTGATQRKPAPTKAKTTRTKADNESFASTSAIDVPSADSGSAPSDDPAVLLICIQS